MDVPVHSEMSPFLLLPIELKLYIMSFLNVESVLLMRLVCTTLVPITKSRALWLALLHESRVLLPYSPDVRPLVERNDSACPELLSTQAIVESAMIHACRLTRTWPRPRMRQPTKLHTQRNGDSCVLSMELFLDRWLLYGYSEGQIYLWDIDPSDSSPDDGVTVPRQCASLDVGPRNWTSLAASLDMSNEYIIIALMRASIPSIAQVYRIRIQSNPDAVLDGTFELLHTLVSPVPQLVKMIQPSMQLMVLSGPNTIDVVFASTNVSAPDVGGVVKKMSIAPGRFEESLDRPYLDGVIDARIMETYLVVFKTRSIQVHPLVADMDAGASYCAAYYAAPNDFPLAYLSFRRVSISDYTVDKETLSFSFYGYDSIQGFFRFQVQIVSNEVSTLSDPFLNLNCVGIRPLSDGIYEDGVLLCGRNNSSRSIISSSAQSAPLRWIPSARVISDTVANIRRSACAMSLGPQGKRAAWVEKERSKYEVFVWQNREVENEVILPHEAVYCTESDGMLGDLTHCTIGEVSGTIVLGNREGDVFILWTDL